MLIKPGIKYERSENELKYLDVTRDVTHSPGAKLISDSPHNMFILSVRFETASLRAGLLDYLLMRVCGKFWRREEAEPARRIRGGKAKVSLLAGYGIA